MPQRSRRQVCRPREKREERWQFCGGTAPAMPQLTLEPARRLTPEAAMVHEQGAGQFPLPLRIPLQRRTAKTAFGRITELRPRSTRQQLRQRNAPAEKEFGRPWCRGVCAKRLSIGWGSQTQVPPRLVGVWMGDCHVGLVGFEPTACRRGDRSIIPDRAHLYLGRSCSIARVALLPNEWQNFRCGPKPKARHAA